MVTGKKQHQLIAKAELMSAYKIMPLTITAQWVTFQNKLSGSPLRLEIMAFLSHVAAKLSWLMTQCYWINNILNYHKYSIHLNQ